jgi:integrase
MNKLYNEEIKKEFLSTYDNEQTQVTIEYILYKAASMEEALEKDLYDFNVNELGKTIRNSDPLNITVARSTGRILSAYITWASEKGLRQTNINPIKSMLPEWYEQFVSKKKLFISLKELKDIENQLVNAQDAVILYLLFEGINGEGNTEILNLRKQDVNQDTNELKLTEVRKNGEKRERTIKVSDDCIRVINQAINQKAYQNKNGNAVTTRGMAETDLVENAYVVRSINRRIKDPNAPADKHTLFRRVTMISELFDLPYLTMKSIERSGMIKMAKDLYLEEGELDTEQLSKVAYHFGRRKVNVNGSEYYHLTPVREFCNLETIQELYGNILAK